jgi:hypothetical protein
LTDYNNIIAPNSIKILQTANPSKGASESEIIHWFKNCTKSVLHFHSLYGAFDKFENNQKNMVFKNAINSGFITTKAKNSLPIQLM